MRSLNTVNLPPAPHACAEIDRIQKGEVVVKKEEDETYLDLFATKNIKLKERVLIPVKQYPKGFVPQCQQVSLGFMLCACRDGPRRQEHSCPPSSVSFVALPFNFVGKILGPQGNTIKRLQEETGAKISVLGKGSMRDKTKEEQLRKGGEPKYAHLSMELHVFIEVFAPVPEAYLRMAHAMEEVKKFLIPDTMDEICQKQFMEMSYLNGAQDSGARGRGGPPGRGRGAPPPPSSAARYAPAEQCCPAGQLVGQLVA
ncbi:hypothetical protein Z043_116961 [Scleropages formosus]|uniref:K Homology domain-containing protein n=1 Tax=Scleropages formosus TaxID=113540 RepID=A0A0P7U3T5_SCLFO|nr:hypothetical protein Z043_116961 [Scleropages formosus]